MLRPYRLERELDRAVVQWLDWLPRWEPAMTRPKRSAVCPVCPLWVDGLQLLEVPHGAMHALVTALHALVDEHFSRQVASTFPRFTESGGWRLAIRSAEVEVLAPADAPEATDEASAHLETELTRMHERLLHDAVARVGLQRLAIVGVLESVVEPKVQALADLMIAEVFGEEDPS